MKSSLESLAGTHASAFGRRVAERYEEEHLPPIIEIDLFLTEECNLRCDYCFVGEKRPRRLSWETARQSVDFLMKHSKSEMDLYICLFGGEPLLEFSLMKRVVEYAQDRASNLGKTMHFSCTTNGTIMSQEIAEFGMKHGFNFLLSIDGDKIAHDAHRKMVDGSGTWDIVMGRNFDILCSCQGWIGARFTIGPDTIERLSISVEDLFARGVNQFLLGYNLNANWNDDSLALLAAEYHKVFSFYETQRLHGMPIRIAPFEDKLDTIRDRLYGRWGCGAGRSRMAISSWGDIYPCARFVDCSSKMEKYKLGTVYDGISAARTRQELVCHPRPIQTKCLKCSYQDYCSGGCYAVNLDVCGNIFAPNPVDCFTTRLFVDLLSSLPDNRCMCDPVTFPYTPPFA